MCVCVVCMRPANPMYDRYRRRFLDSRYCYLPGHTIYIKHMNNFMLSLSFSCIRKCILYDRNNRYFRQLEKGRDCEEERRGGFSHTHTHIIILDFMMLARESLLFRLERRRRVIHPSNSIHLAYIFIEACIRSSLHSFSHIFATHSFPLCMLCSSLEREPGLPKS